MVAEERRAVAFAADVTARWPAAASLSHSNWFNDAWQLQDSLGAKMAVDSRRRLWLGVTGRFINNFGPGKGRWAGFGPSAAFRFGH